MQGVVSKTGGTEAGVLPKYKNDIYLYINKVELKHLTITPLIIQISYIRRIIFFFQFSFLSYFVIFIYGFDLLKWSQSITYAIFILYIIITAFFMDSKSTKAKPKYVKKEESSKLKYVAKQEKVQMSTNKTEVSQKMNKEKISKDESNSANLRIASEASKIPTAPKWKEKQDFYSEDIENQSHPIKDLVDDSDLRKLKKRLVEVIQSQSIQKMSIRYNPYQPKIFFQCSSKGGKKQYQIRDIIEANSNMKLKDKKLISNIYQSLYKKVQAEYYDFGLIGIELNDRVRFRDRNWKNRPKAQVTQEYLFYYTVLGQKFNFVMFDSGLNSILFSSNQIYNVRRNYQKQFQVFLKFEKKNKKDMEKIDQVMTQLGQQQIDSQEEQRVKRISQQKSYGYSQLKEKIMKIINKDITYYQERIQEKNERVLQFNKTGQQSTEFIQKLAQQVGEQHSSLQNFIETRNSVQQILSKKFISEQEELKSIKNCLKRMIIAQKQLVARLPIISKKRQIFQKLNKNNLLILEGQTGSGKSTQLPQILCEYYKIFQNEKSLPVLITQPRKLATRTLAERVAQQMQERVHDFVDYQTTLTTKINENAKIVFKMDRLVLDELKIDPKLSKYCCLVIDEAHERTISIDVILGLIKKLLSLRSDFKIIVTSASMDTNLFKNYFKTQILKVSGRMFPVQQIFKPYDNKETTTQKIKSVIESQLLDDNERNLRQQYKGHVLVFCSGVDQIQQLSTYFTNKLNPRTFKVYGLHGKLSSEQQKQVFKDCEESKIIFATRIAETSITIDKVKVVIDPGQDREMVYDQKNKVTSLKLNKISQSSAKQRAGRAGRTNSGFCFRLYTRAQKNDMRVNKVPEMQNMAMDTVVLRLKSLQIEDIINFPYLSPPSREGLLNSIEIMKMLRCLDEKTEKITPIGQFLVKVPIEPFLARAIIQGMLFEKIKNNKKNLFSTLKMDDREKNKLLYTNFIEEVIRILSLVVSSTNLFYIRVEDRERADRQKFQKLKDEDGDFFFLQNIYSQYLKFNETNRDGIRRWAKQHFINLKTLKQTRDLQKQITQIIRQFTLNDELLERFIDEAEVKLKQAKSVREVILCCLISSFATNLALKSLSQKNNEVIGYTIVSNELTMQIYGTSILNLQGICPKWILFYDLYENQKGQMYCKIANTIDFDFMLKNMNPYIRKKFNLERANQINPYYSCITKKFPSLVFLDMLEDYKKRFYENNKKLQFLDKFTINFDEQHSQIDFFYKKSKSDLIQLRSPYFSLLKQSMNKFLGVKNYQQSSDPIQIIQGYTKQMQFRYKKPINYNYVGPIYINLKEGFELIGINFNVFEHIYKITASVKQCYQHIVYYCRSFGTCQIFENLVTFRIIEQQQVKLFQSTLQALKQSYKKNHNVDIKWVHEFEDRRKKIPQVKLFMHFWAGECSKNNIFIDYANQKLSSEMIQAIYKVQRQVRNKLFGLKFSLTKNKKGINCYSHKQNLDQIELFQIFEEYNKQNVFGYNFKMPKYIKKFREPDISLSTKNQGEWVQDIKEILEDNDIKVDRASIRVWGRSYYTQNQMKDQKISQLEKMMKVQLHAEIKSYQFKKLKEFQEKFNKKQGIIGSEKVHLIFQFEQTAVVTTLRAFDALYEEFEELVNLTRLRNPLITIQNFNKINKKFTKVFIKIRGPNRDDLIWPTMQLTKLFTPKLIPLPENKFRFLDKMNEGNDLLDEIQKLYDFKIYFSFERKTFNLKLYCDDTELDKISKLLEKRLNQYQILECQISYKGKNLNKILQILKNKEQQLNNNKQKRYFNYHILFKFRKVRITGDVRTCDEIENQIMGLINRQKAQCQICSSIFQKPYRLFSCGHEFCWNCLISYVRESISNVSNEPLKCLTCPKLISVFDVQKLMTPEQFNKFCDIRIARHIEKDKEYHGCFSPNCENIFVAKQSLRDNSFECDLCGKWYCFKCKQSHKGYNCDEWKFKLDDKALLQFGIKKCPNCGNGIQKNQGCQHITCTCKKHICWNCMKVFDDDKACYDHLAKQCGGIFARNP